ncbi:MAG: ATP-binding cassette domain-containing protein [Coriobacteriia bacterium]|nr:ATP-binding cassette domain-containing protein [Coriobacteriia bacterium]
MIDVRDVMVVYPGAGRPALDGVSLTLSPGESVALLGANGSGKSTLARLCNALLLPSAGTVSVDGMDTRDAAAVWDVRSRVGFVQQNPENQIVGTVAEEDVAFGPENLGVPAGELRRRVDDALEAVGLAGMQRREPHLLSDGQKQRLAIAGALAMCPAYLVLDEPTAMLDGTGRAEVAAVLQTLRDEGVGILHITHQLAEAADADRLVVLSEGRIVYEGTPLGLIGEPERAERYGVDLPHMAVLTAGLRARGIDVPALMLDAESVVEALWR